NWANFTPDERAQCDEFWGDPPRFGEHHLTFPLRVVVLLREGEARPPGYTCYRLPKIPEAKHPRELKQSEGEATLAVDIAESGWYEQLMGKPVATEKGWVITEGLLDQAVREKKSLKLYQESEDPLCKSLIEQLQVERRFVSKDAQLLPLPEG